MKKTYTLFQQQIAYVLLASFFLQSCDSLNHPITPIEKEPATSLQTHVQASLLPTHIEPLINQALTAKGGHLVTFYQEDGKLKSNVEINAPQGFSKTYQGADVLLEEGANISRLSNLDPQSQQRRIHFQLEQGGNPARIIIYSEAIQVYY